MSNEQERLSYLLQRYAANDCTKAELNELIHLIKEDGNQSQMLAALKEVWEQTTSEPAKDEQEWDRLYSSIAETSRAKPIKFPMWQRIGAAAALFILCTVGLLMYQQGKEIRQPNAAKVKSAQELAPGGNKAVLTLANGQKIVLDGKNDGVIASQTGITISKATNGQLIYKLSSTTKVASSDAYNTIEVPKGGQYQVTMADGTKVWLNAMSSLRYPLSFKNNQREVELNGEGYFEVAKNPNAPFKVQTRNQTLTVLGTHFNINAYQDEQAIRTTLLEGAVRVKATGNNGSTLLAPGQQATLLQRSIAVKEIDVDLAVAWKNGTFMFSNDNLENIMRQIARWYDVEVVYSNQKVKDYKLSGSISRFENASQILDILELTKKVHFKVEGRRVIVM